VALVRTGADSTGIAYPWTGKVCLLIGQTGGIALAPGDSLTSQFTFRACFYHPLSPSDSAGISGPMRLQYLVTSTPGPYASPEDLIPDALRVSPAFVVRLP
jgi:hypothetical protein